jgi:predicted nucleic acid-binding protein
MFRILEGESPSGESRSAAHRRLYTSTRSFWANCSLGYCGRIRPPSRKQGLDEFLRDLTVVDVTSDVARKFGEVRAGLFDRGLPMPPMDLMIAATALVNNFTLVTHNTADYANVPNLRTVDWLIP